MNEVSESIKKTLMAAVLLLALFIAAASLLIFVVDVLGSLSSPTPTLENAVKVQAIYTAQKAKLDYLFQPIDRMSTLLQILAAAVIGYIFTKETGPALARFASVALAQRQQNGPIDRQPQ